MKTETETSERTLRSACQDQFKVCYTELILRPDEYNCIISINTNIGKPMHHVKLAFINHNAISDSNLSILVDHISNARDD